jgi:hypothetical protein
VRPIPLPRYTRAPLECFIDEHDARPRRIERAGFGDDDDVVQPRDAAFQQPQLFLRSMPRRHVAQMDGHARAEGVAAYLYAAGQARVECLRLQQLVAGKQLLEGARARSSGTSSRSGRPSSSRAGLPSSSSACSLT